MDKDTSIDELRQLVARFVGERQWEPFHTPKNLSMALAIEAAELMEHFQWLTPDESAALAAQPDKLAEVADELADVTCYALALCNALAIDLAGAVQRKMVKNAEKYPAAQFRGRWGHGDTARGPGARRAARPAVRPAVGYPGRQLPRRAVTWCDWPPAAAPAARHRRCRSSPCRLRIA